VVQALVAQVVRHKQQTATLHQLQTLAAVAVVLQVEHLQQQLVETVVQVL
jgi:hypothetical protein